MKAIVLCLFVVGHCLGIEPPVDPEPGFPGLGDSVESIEEQEKLPASSEERLPSGVGSEGKLGSPSEEVPQPKTVTQDDNEYECPFKCTDESKKQFNNDAEFMEYLGNLGKPIRFKDQFSAKHLQKYCKMNEYNEACTKKCPDSKYKTFILDGIQMQILCKDKRMLDESSKFNQVFNDKLEECSQTCSEYGKNLTQIVNEREPSLNATEILEISCNYMLCFSQCEHDSLLAEVGEDNTKYYEKLVAQSIKFTRASAKVNDELLELPEVCLKVEKLGNDEIPAPEKFGEEEEPPVIGEELTSAPTEELAPAPIEESAPAPIEAHVPSEGAQ